MDNPTEVPRKTKAPRIAPGLRADVDSERDRENALRAFTEGRADYLELRDKVRFNTLKRDGKEEKWVSDIYEVQEDRPKFRCVPTQRKYYTNPDRKYGTDDDCPIYGSRVEKGWKNAGCCTLKDRGSDAWDFLKYLANSVFRVEQRQAAEKVLSPDLVKWIYWHYHDSLHPTGPLRMNSYNPYVNEVVHFLFLAKPLFRVILENNDYSTRVLYDYGKRLWSLNADDKELVERAKKTGINGHLTYNPIGTSTEQIALVHELVRIRAPVYEFLGNVGNGYVDVTDIASHFASGNPVSGPGVTKEIRIRGKGIVSKNKSFYDLILEVIHAMPAGSCVFEMGIDLGVDPVEEGIHEAYTHVHPTKDVLIGHLMNPPVNDNEVMNGIYGRLQVDLPTKHRVPFAFATSGVLGYHEKTLYPDNDVGDPVNNYSLTFEIGSMGYPGQETPEFELRPIDPYFRLTKKMLTHRDWYWHTHENGKQSIVWGRR